jgi:phospholipid-binding lipoprotein MlaA
MRFSSRNLSAFILLVASLLGGCATTGNRQDPLEPLNRGIYQFNDTVDKAVLKPVAEGYKAILPSFVRTAVGNFFSNLNDVLVVLNDLLQLKLEQGASDLSRLVWNTTAGIGGLIDVATPMGMEKHKEDFGLTLGHWGVGNGPYLVLPILGPSTLRDGFGILVDAQADPIWNYNDVTARNTAIVIKTVDTRARLLGTETILETAAIDPYTFVRDGYLQRRKALIFGGKPPLEDDDYYEEPAAPAGTESKPAPQP